MNGRQFIRSIKDTYNDEDYCTVVGFEAEMEMFRDWARLKGFRPVETWKFHTVCVWYYDVHGKTVGLFFEKEDEDGLRELCEDKMFNGWVCINGSNPFV